MPNPVIYAENYLSHYAQRQAAKGVVVHSREVKHQMQVCRRQDVDFCSVKASNGWLQAFLKRCKMQSADVCGEKMSADLEAVLEFVSEKSNLTSDCASVCRHCLPPIGTASSYSL